MALICANALSFPGIRVFCYMIQILTILETGVKKLSLSDILNYLSYFCRRFMQQIEEIYLLLKEPRKVVITTHQKPDGDAMGSSLGLSNFLAQLGHEVKVISPTNWADFL